MNQGLFKPLVMFFGLTNSPATFQTMMNDIFKDLIDKGYMAIYMDNILVYTCTIEHHGQSGRIRGDCEHTGGYTAVTFQNLGHICSHLAGEVCQDW